MFSIHLYIETTKSHLNYIPTYRGYSNFFYLIMMLSYTTGDSAVYYLLMFLHLLFLLYIFFI